MAPQVTDVVFARDRNGVISAAGQHVYTDRNLAETHETTGKKHPLVDNTLYLEQRYECGLRARTLPQVVALRNGDPKGDISENKLHEWTDTPTTFQSFELLYKMLGYERGDRILLVAHTPLPHGIRASDMLDALAGKSMRPRYGFPVTNKQGFERLIAIRDSYSLLTPEQARKEATGQVNLLAGTCHGVLLPGNARPEQIIDAATSYQTEAYNDTLRHRDRLPARLYGGDVLNDNGAWLASLGDGISNGDGGLFVGDDGFYYDARFLVGSAGGAPAHEQAPEKPTATPTTGPDLEKIAADVTTPVQKAFALHLPR